MHDWFVSSVKIPCHDNGKYKSTFYEEAGGASLLNRLQQRHSEIDPEQIDSILNDMGIDYYYTAGPFNNTENNCVVHLAKDWKEDNPNDYEVIDIRLRCLRRVI